MSTWPLRGGRVVEVLIAHGPSPTAYVIAGLALAKLVVHLLTNGQYGYHRDELYYLASANHPAAGYVDYPPLTPLLARLDALLLGNSPWTLRLLPSLVGAILVVLVALLAAEFGAGRKAQMLAALATATSTLLLGTNWLFQTVTFDQLWWILTFYAFARLLRTGNLRQWLLIGALLGLGLETKVTIGALCLGIVVGVLATPLRNQLRSIWPWVGAVLACLLIAPNLVWQQLNGWPTLDFVRTHGAVIQSAAQGISLDLDSGGPLAFVVFQPLFIGVVTLPVWAAGWYFLFRNQQWRPLGIAALVPYVVFLFVGKAYYPGPVILVLFAAGCVQLERVAAGRAWRHAERNLAIAMVLQALVLLPLGVPAVPQSALARFGLDTFRKDYADTVGWPELVDQVAAAYQQVPAADLPRTVILAANYGEAGAIDLYGPSRGLPAALSPQLTFWYWKPAHVDARTVVTIGFNEAGVQSMCPEARVVDRVRPVDGVHNEEVNWPIMLCQSPTVSLDDIWPRLRTLN